MTELDPDLVRFASRMFDLARSGDTAELAAHLADGVQPDLANEHGDTLLMLAAYHGHADTVAALLERGADAGRANDRGQTPLAGAVFKADEAVIKLLLDYGADATAGNPSALDTARMFGREDLLGAAVAQEE